MSSQAETVPGRRNFISAVWSVCGKCMDSFICICECVRLQSALSISLLLVANNHFSPDKKNPMILWCPLIIKEQESTDLLHESLIFCSISLEKTVFWSIYAPNFHGKNIPVGRSSWYVHISLGNVYSQWKVFVNALNVHFTQVLKTVLGLYVQNIHWKLNQLHFD